MTKKENKYIDADKLIAEIKRLDKENKELLKSGGSIGREFLFGIGAGYADVIKIIASLQQEQPEPSNLVDVDAVREDFIAEVYRVLDADSTNDRANAIIDAFDSFPTVSQIQPEVDLDAIVDEAFDKYSSVDGYGQLSVSFNRAELYSFIKKLARKEE